MASSLTPSSNTTTNTTTMSTNTTLASDSVSHASVKNLILLAKDIRKNAYCPYSKFQVGAAILCEDGTFYTGKSIIYLFFFDFNKYCLGLIRCKC